MKITPSHSVKFARSLALATTLALPACGASDPTPTTTDPPAQGTKAAETDRAPSTASTTPAPTAAASTTAAPAEETADAGVSDSGRISGPLPPPELPASMVSWLTRHALPKVAQVS